MRSYVICPEKQERTVVDVEVIPSDPDPEKVEVPADPGEREAFPVMAKENPQTEAQQLYTQALKLKEEIETKWYDLGRVLEILFEKKYYLDYAPNWKEFCRTSFDFEWRYADYLRVTSRKCDEVGIDPGEAAKIGIAKMKEVVPIITRSNKNHWLSEARKCTTAGLNAKVRLARGRITKDEAARVPIKVFIPLYEAQKEVWDRAFELAGKILGSDKKGVQAEMIAAEFLSTYEQPDKEWPRARIAAA